MNGVFPLMRLEQSAVVRFDLPSISTHLRRALTRTVLGLTGYLLLGWSATADSAPATNDATASPAQRLGSAGPRIAFAETVYDFGKVVGGDVVKHSFVFTNTGNGLLIIRDVHSSCGCTVATNWSRQVEAGKTGAIPIEFHTGNFRGAIVKPVSVVSNATNQPSTTLQMKGTIWRPIELTPSSVSFGGVVDSLSNAVKVVRIVNQQDEPLTLWPPQSNRGTIAAELRTNRVGNEYELLIRLVPPMGLGNVFGQITLQTSAPKMPLLTVPVFAVAQPAVMALPSLVMLPPPPIINALTQSVSIRSLWTNALTLTNISFNGQGVDVQLRELQPGRFFSVRLVFPAGFEIQPGERLELTAHSNHPQYPILKVPVGQRSAVVRRFGAGGPGEPVSAPVAAGEPVARPRGTPAPQ